MSFNIQGIRGVSLSRDNVEVLGNMICTLNESYIQESDPIILEKLKACKDFSDGQVSAIETVLLSGTTQYGYDDPFRCCDKSSGMLICESSKPESLFTQWS